MTKYYQMYVLVLCLLLDSTRFVFAGAPVGGAEITSGLNEYCTLDSECLPNGICNSNMTCKCDQGFKPSTSNDCEAVITGDCSYDVDCNHYLVHTYCDYFLASCVCLHGAYDSATRSCPCPELGDKCNLDEECTSCLNNTECQGFGVSKTCECAAGFYIVNGVCSKGLNENCSLDSECLPDGMCNSNMTCECEQGFKPSTSNDCEAVITGDCSQDADCNQYLLHTDCDYFLFYCVCFHGAYDSATRSCPCPALGDKCNLDEECTSCLNNTECQGFGVRKTCECVSGFENANGVCVKGLGANCTVDSECLPNAICDLTTSTCVCKQAYRESTKGDCEEVYQASCTVDSECYNYLLGSKCSNFLYYCGCKNGFWDYDATSKTCLCPGMFGDCDINEECSTCIPNTECVSSRCQCGTGFENVNGTCTLGLGANCTIDSECLPNAICDSTTLTCVCEQAYRESTRGDCEEVYQASCTLDSQCYNYLFGSKCSNFLRYCGCKNGFWDYDVTSKTCPCSGMFGDCNIDEECSTCIPNAECISSSCQCSSGFEYVNDTCTLVTTTSAATTTTTEQSVTTTSAAATTTTTTEQSVTTTSAATTTTTTTTTEQSVTTTSAAATTTTTTEQSVPTTSSAATTTTTKHLATSTKGAPVGGTGSTSGLGANCMVDSDCLPNAICDSTTLTCVCGQAYRESTKHGCEKVFLADCAIDSECYNYLLGSRCSGFLFYCGCKKGFFDYNHTSNTCPCTGMFGECDIDEECSTCILNAECISSSCQCATGFEYVNNACTPVTANAATTTTKHSSITILTFLSWVTVNMLFFD